MQHPSTACPAAPHPAVPHSTVVDLDCLHRTVPHPAVPHPAVPHPPVPHPCVLHPAALRPKDMQPIVQLPLVLVSLVKYQNDASLVPPPLTTLPCLVPYFPSARQRHPRNPCMRSALHPPYTSSRHPSSPNPSQPKCRLLNSIAYHRRQLSHSLPQNACRARCVADRCSTWHLVKRSPFQTELRTHFWGSPPQSRSVVARQPGAGLPACLLTARYENLPSNF